MEDERKFFEKLLNDKLNEMKVQAEKEIAAAAENFKAG